MTLPLLLLSGLLYARGRRSARGMKRWQTLCFWSGLAALALALLSPLHSRAEVLFSAHMVQHEVLILIAAPLLVLSRPLVPMLWALPFDWRRTLGRWSAVAPIRRTWCAITAPPVAWILHAAALWLWHTPALFQAALFSEWVHAAQHIAFFGSALLFWWSLFHSRGPASYGPAVLYLFTTAVHTSILGALLTFSHTVWYPVYSVINASALSDQQLGGLLMWIPGGLVYLGASMFLLAAWLRESELMAQAGRYAN